MKKIVILTALCLVTICSSAQQKQIWKETKEEKYINLSLLVNKPNIEIPVIEIILNTKK